MNLGELRALARVKLDDLVEPYLWSDEFLDETINRAQDEAIFRSGGVVDDFSPSLVTGVVLAGDSYCPVDARVLKVEAVRIGTTSLVPASMSSLNNLNPGWEDANPGTPAYFVFTGSKVRLYPAPVVDTTITMTVRRSSLTKLTLDTHVSEVAYPLHNALLHFVLAECYDLPDADISNPDAVVKHTKAFEGVFGARPSAKLLSAWKTTPTRAGAIMRRI